MPFWTYESQPNFWLKIQKVGWTRHALLLFYIILCVRADEFAHAF